MTIMPRLARNPLAEAELLHNAAVRAIAAIDGAPEFESIEDEVAFIEAASFEANNLASQIMRINSASMTDAQRRAEAWIDGRYARTYMRRVN